MIEYAIVEWEGQSTEVEALITRGWCPQGGVAIVPYQDFNDRERWRYVQAMVRPKPPTKADTFDRLPGIFAAAGLGTAGGGVSTEGASWAMEGQRG